MIDLELVSAPSTEPWTLDEVKAHLRLDTSLTDEDAYLNALIKGVRQSLESAIGCAMFEQTRKRRLDAWPGRIYLPRPPLQSVTTVAYTDVDGNAATFTNYTVVGSRSTPDADAPLAYIEPAYGYSWPSIRAVPRAITITYVCGWKTAAAIPQPIRHAVLLLCAEMYENREVSISGTITEQMPWFQRLVGEYRARYRWAPEEEWE